MKKKAMNYSLIKIVTSGRNITVGKYQSSHFEIPTLTHILEANKLLSQYNVVLRSCNDSSNHTGNKELNKFLAQKLGPKFRLRLSAAFYYAWIKPHHDLIYKTIFFIPERKELFKRSNAFLVNLFYQNKEMVLQMVKDNQQHLISWCLVFERTPQEMKVFLGKAIWKRLAKNSMSYNKKILYSYLGLEHHHLITLDSSRDHNWSTYCVVDFYNYDSTNYDEYMNSDRYKQLKSLISDEFLEYKRGVILRLLHIKSSCYSSIRASDNNIDALIWASHTKGIKTSPSPSTGLGYWTTIYQDTERMCNELNWTFNKNWSKNKMLNKHDLAVLKVNERSFSNYDLSWLKRIKETIEFGPIKIMVLNNIHSLIQESEELKHCILSFVPGMSAKKYISLRVFGEVQRVTIGYFISWHDNQCTLELDQAHGFRNEMLTDKSIESRISVIKDWLDTQIRGALQGQGDAT